MSVGVGHRRRSDLALLWLWHGPVATALTLPLVWEPPYAMGTALKRPKKKKSDRTSRSFFGDCHVQLWPVLLCHTSAVWFAMVQRKMFSLYVRIHQIKQTESLTNFLYYVVSFGVCSKTSVPVALIQFPWKQWQFKGTYSTATSQDRNMLLN